MVFSFENSTLSSEASQTCSCSTSALSKQHDELWLLEQRAQRCLLAPSAETVTAHRDTRHPDKRPPDERPREVSAEMGFPGQNSAALLSAVLCSGASLFPQRQAPGITL